MTIRRLASWVSTVAVVIAVAFAVPILQLRTVSIAQACCCPDPSHCHCPDHEPDPASQPTFRLCHKTQDSTVTAQLPAFDPPAVAETAVHGRIRVTIAQPPRAPHAAPTVARSAAPS